MSNYSNNLNCEWLLENPQHINSSIVVLLEDLHVQDDQTCGKDFLQFRLGESDMKAFCLLLSPPFMMISSFSLTLGLKANKHLGR